MSNVVRCECGGVGCALCCPDSCPNCGELGDPGHHWMSQPEVFEGYVCSGKDSAN